MHAIANGQEMALSNAHAHNDYYHPRPLLDALNKGYTSIEADIFLRKGELVVAHFLPELHKKRLLEELYLKPLFELSFRRTPIYSSFNEPMILLIDIKSSPVATYNALKQVLEKYRPMLTCQENGQIIKRAVTVVISGRKPSHMILAEKERLVFIDEDLRQFAKAEGRTLFTPLASARYSRILNSKRGRAVPEKERARLCMMVSRAHQQGLRVRIWGVPENESVWKLLLGCGVDYIATDKLQQLRDFLLTMTPVKADDSRQ